MVSKKHLLVIRMSAMGDVAMTAPVLSALSQKYPDVKVTLLTKTFFKPIFNQLPNVSVYTIDVKGKHKGVLGLWKLYKELKSLQIDAVADLHNVLRSNILKQFFKLGGFSFEQIDKGRSEKKNLTAKKNKKFKALKTTHQRYADVFNLLGFSLDLSEKLVLEHREISDKIKNVSNFDEKIVIGIAPFAAFEGKMYPLNLMEEVVSELNKTEKYRILLFGGGKIEQEQLEIWESHYTDAVSIVSKASLTEELDLISNLDVMLAMDSGNAHLAALFGVPTITLWGVTHPHAGFYPFGQDKENALVANRDKFPLIPTSIYGNKMPEGYEEAMKTIDPKSVIRKIQSVLSKNRSV